MDSVVRGANERAVNDEVDPGEDITAVLEGNLNKTKQ
jgi:hypothetical protein